MNRIYLITFITLTLGFIFLLSCVPDKDPLIVTGNIVGQVIDADTKQPLKSVNVTISPSGLTTVTADDGRYEFSDIDAGLYSVQFVKRGYISNTKQITVTAGSIASGDCLLLQGAVEIKLNVSELNFGDNSNSLVFRIENMSAVRPFEYEISNILSCITLSSVTGTVGIGKSVEIIATLNRNMVTSTLSEMLVIYAEGTTISLPVKILATSAIVNVYDFLSISDGLYFYFSPSLDTKSYYWNVFSPEELPNNDEDIIEDLLDNGVNMDMNGSQEGYSWDLDELTKYTLCVVAYDSQNRQGELVKKEITTKSSVNQPIAKLSINEFRTEGELYMSGIKNTYCYSFVTDGHMVSVDEVDDDFMNTPDILFAAVCYENYKNGKIEYVDINNWSSIWPSNCVCVAFSLGFSQIEQNSGVVDKIYFSTESNTILSQSNLRQIKAKMKQIGKSKLKF